MVLPEGLQFPNPGWWLTHAVYVLLIYSWGYRKGRREERKARGAISPETAPR
jgi:hypothetical protein